MSASSAAVSIGVVSSGSPAYLDQQSSPRWPTVSASTNLASSLMGAFTVMVTSGRETVFLTRAHQRIMDRALSRSVRFID
jgi:hypothetical protein